jgi:hypothetical protein
MSGAYQMVQHWPGCGIPEAVPPQRPIAWTVVTALAAWRRRKVPCSCGGSQVRWVKGIGGGRERGAGLEGARGFLLYHMDLI